MAASCSQPVMHHAFRNSGICRISIQRLLANRGFARSSTSRQQPSVSSFEDIVIPKKKTWSKVAVLQALASTLKRDPTASDYRFQDDPFLTPQTHLDFKIFALSQESGRNVAKYFINTYPKYFQKDYAEPHIPCLMPESIEAQIEEVSEAALKERIQLRKVSAAVDLYDQLLQAGTSVSLTMTNDLLDLICLYGDTDPVQEGFVNQRNEETENNLEEPQTKRGRSPKASDMLKTTWKENNNAERIFGLLSEPNTRSYSALIQGMVKHGAYSKAFSTYTDLLNSRLTADVHIFNALIMATPYVREKYNEKWELIVDLLKQMEEQKVKPNLQTLNSTLKALRRCGGLGKAQAFPVINEMKALSIEPSLASYSHLLSIFYKFSSKGNQVQPQTDVFGEVMKEISGKSFSPRDPDDAQFFGSAMRICLDTKDMEQAYRVHELLGVGENWRFLGSDVNHSIYHSRFFSLLCMMESLDVVLKWYRELVPSVYYPSSTAMSDLLRALDTDSRLDLIPQIWKDIKQLGHSIRQKLLEEILTLMAREKHSQEVQESFAECALDIKKVYESNARGKVVLSWTTASLSNLIRILLAAQRRRDAWDVLKLFKSENRVPSAELLNDFLTYVMEAGEVDQAVELLQMSAGFCISETPRFVQRLQETLELSEAHLSVLSDLGIEGGAERNKEN